MQINRIIILAIIAALQLGALWFLINESGGYIAKDLNPKSLAQVKFGMSEVELTAIIGEPFNRFVELQPQNNHAIGLEYTIDPRHISRERPRLNIWLGPDNTVVYAHGQIFLCWMDKRGVYTLRKESQLSHMDAKSIGFLFGVEGKPHGQTHYKCDE